MSHVIIAKPGLSKADREVVDYWPKRTRNFVGAMIVVLLLAMIGIAIARILIPHAAEYWGPGFVAEMVVVVISGYWCYASLLHKPKARLRKLEEASEIVYASGATLEFYQHALELLREVGQTRRIKEETRLFGVVVLFMRKQTRLDQLSASSDGPDDRDEHLENITALYQGFASEIILLVELASRDAQ